MIWLVLVLALGCGLWVVLPGGRWDGKSRFTVISVRNGVQVASFDPRTAEGVKIIFPRNWMITGSGGTGEWLAEKADRADLVAENLGILYATSQSDMGWRDRVQWWWWGRKVKWREVDGGQWMKKELTVDGMEVRRLDETWDSAVRELLASSAVLEERLIVTVVNATDESGLAERMARRIENAGMRVVATKTGEGLVRGCQVVSSKQSKSKTGVRLLVQSFGCEWLAGEAEENEVELFFGQR